MGSKIGVIITERIEQRILLIRGQKVMLDRDLAELYSVPTKALNQAVQRNIQRFPKDFMFRLSRREMREVVTLCDHLEELKFSHSLPYAFTEHGILMLSSVLNSAKAIEVNILIMRTFNKLRELMLIHKDLRLKIEEMEAKYDHQFKLVFNALRKLLTPPRTKPKLPIGFHALHKNPEEKKAPFTQKRC